LSLGTKRLPDSLSHMQRDLDRTQLADTEDWWGNNIALTCPACKKVFIVSAHMKGGERVCPKCGKSRGIVSGGKDSGGTASVIWAD